MTEQRKRTKGSPNDPGDTPQGIPSVATVEQQQIAADQVEIVPGARTDTNGHNPPPPNPPMPPKARKPKSPRSVTYLLIGESKDGSSVDVLGTAETRGRAFRLRDSMAMANARNYREVSVLQCRKVQEA